VSKVIAWLAHLYTATGLVCCAGMAVLIVQGGEAAFRWAFFLMMIATVVDATDGWLARKADVAGVLPGFNGRALDDLIDFHAYTSLPLLLLWRATVLPEHLAWLLLVPLLASAYGFSQVEAKTADGYFLGFPSYWNVVVFYLYILRPPTTLSVAALIVFAVLTFVPTPYLYASRGGRFARIINFGGAVWFALLGVALFGPAEYSIRVAALSMIYPLIYLGLSAVVAAEAGRRTGR
jgi:phosphatidylcholine synthase